MQTNLTQKHVNLFTLIWRHGGVQAGGKHNSILYLLISIIILKQGFFLCVYWYYTCTSWYLNKEHWSDTAVIMLLFTGQAHGETDPGCVWPLARHTTAWHPLRFSTVFLKKDFEKEKKKCPPVLKIPGPASDAHCLGCLSRWTVSRGSACACEPHVHHKNPFQLRAR